jgi:hypothetical protein
LHRKALDRLDLLKDEELILLYKSAEHMSINLLDSKRWASLKNTGYSSYFDYSQAEQNFGWYLDDIVGKATLLCTFKPEYGSYNSPYKQLLIDHFHKNLQADVIKELITTDKDLCANLCIEIFNKNLNFKDQFQGLELDDRAGAAFDAMTKLKKTLNKKELALEDLKVTDADAFWALISYLPKAIYSFFGGKVELSTRALKNNVRSFVQAIENKAKNNEYISLPIE